MILKLPILSQAFQNAFSLCCVPLTLHAFLARDHCLKTLLPGWAKHVRVVPWKEEGCFSVSELSWLSTSKGILGNYPLSTQ